MKVLVVDDEKGLADLVAFTLEREGFNVVQAHDGEVAIQAWADEQPDIIVLDVNLPKRDGFTVCREIRQQGETPIIMLTARDKEDDVVHGLGIGADDYIVKPFSYRNLIARINAVLRRAGKNPAVAVRRVAGLELDSDWRAVRVEQNEPITLTALESRLLEVLMANPGRTLLYETLLRQIWGSEGGDRDMLRQLIHRLRSKIEPDPSQPRYIENVPGLGYGLAVQEQL